MRRTVRRRFGAGFLFLLAAVAAGAGLFLWGLRTPPLERVWTMQLELMLGTRPPLYSSELHLLQSTLVRYPELAESMLEGSASGIVSANLHGAADTGYAYVVRRDPGVPTEVVVSSPTGESFEIEIRTGDTMRTGRVTPDRPHVLRLPDTGSFPQLVELRVAAPTDAGAPVMVVALRTAP